MKKSTVRWWVILVVALVVYNVIVFVIPFPKNAVFFLSWIFTLGAIGAQVYVVHTAFGKDETVKSKFYGFPVARIGAVYLAVQLALGTVFMALGFVVEVPVWIPLVLYIVLLGAATVGFVAADATRDEIQRQDVKFQKNVSCMRALQSKVGALHGQVRDPALLREIQAFSEALRYSDPVSSEAIAPIEAELTSCVDEVQRAIVDEDHEGAATLLKRAGNLLTERNRLCKLNKSAAH